MPVLFSCTLMLQGTESPSLRNYTPSAFVLADRKVLTTGEEGATDQAVKGGGGTSGEPESPQPLAVSIDSVKVQL